MSAEHASARDKLARRFRGQARSCADLGSPLYAALLARAASDIEAAGAVWRVLEPLSGLPGGALVALRFMGATHRRALEGAAPELATHYPSCGGDGDPDRAWEALRGLAEAAAGTGDLDDLLRCGVQTNEVGRSAALLGGFLEVAAPASGLPLRLLEVGASAGLNLRWDRFHYDGWGPTSTVELGDRWVGDRRPLFQPVAVTVVERSGCDLDPVDPTTGAGQLTLLSFVWPDMDQRFHLLDAACRLAADVPALIEEADADQWVAGRVADRVPGAATVVFHSVVLNYLDEDARQRLLTCMSAAGAVATASAPFAWLRLEPPGALGPPEFEVRLTTWPGGEDRRLAMCHPHGAWVRWE